MKKLTIERLHTILQAAGILLATVGAELLAAGHEAAVVGGTIVFMWLIREWQSRAEIDKRFNEAYKKLENVTQELTESRQSHL